MNLIWETLKANMSRILLGNICLQREVEIVYDQRQEVLFCIEDNIEKESTVICLVD